MDFGKRVRQEREGQNFSQETLAIAAGVSRRTIQNVEAGRTTSAETARAIMAVLGMEEVRLGGEDAGAREVAYGKAFAGLICLISALAFVAGIFHSGLVVVDGAGLRVDATKLSFQLFVGMGSIILVAGLYATAMVLWGKTIGSWRSRAVVFVPTSR